MGERERDGDRGEAEAPDLAERKGPSWECFQLMILARALLPRAPKVISPSHAALPDRAQEKSARRYSQPQSCALAKWCGAGEEEGGRKRPSRALPGGAGETGRTGGCYQ